MLSKTAEYALRAVTCLGSRIGQPSSADVLAEETKVPRRYLNRVLQDLAASAHAAVPAAATSWRKILQRSRFSMWSMLSRRWSGSIPARSG